MTDRLQFMSCAALWTAALALALVGAERLDHVMMFLAIEMSIVAALFTAYVMVLCIVRASARRERLKFETVANLVAAKAIDQCNDSRVTRLR